MIEKRIFILSGPIRSGKTTRLLNWSTVRDDIYGILTPEISGKRVFMDIHSKEQFAMEANLEEKAIITIGRFAFSQSAFLRAIDIIRLSLKNRKMGWLIIDEIGPLELKNGGFATVLKEVIHLQNSEKRILLVVRDGLSEKVKKKFGINDAIVITTIDSDLFAKRKICYARTSCLSRER